MKKAIRRSVVGAVAVVSMAAMANATSASPLAYNGFGSTTSSTSLLNAGTDTGWNANWGTEAGSLATVAGLSVPAVSQSIYGYSSDASTNSSAGQTIGFNQATSASAVRIFNGGTDINTGQVWISFLMNRAETGRFAGLSLFNSVGGAELIDMGVQDQSGSTWGGGGANAINYNINNNAAGGTLAVTNPGQAVSGQNANTVLMVAEIDFSPGAAGANAYFWVDPSSSTSFTPSGDYETITGMTTLTTDGIDTLRIFAGGISGAVSTTATYDEIRIGPTLGDVVPEPSSLAILGLPALAILARRRRRAAI